MQETFMGKLRSVNTKFWDDSYSAELDPIEKLLFLYLITNPLTNMLGVYEITLRRIAFDTGIDKDMVLKIMKRFEADNKATYLDGYVVLFNFLKNQSLNSNMKKSACNEFEALPGYLKESESFESIRKALESFEIFRKIEVERETEYKRETEVEDSQKTPIDFLKSETKAREMSFMGIRQEHQKLSEQQFDELLDKFYIEQNSVAKIWQNERDTQSHFVRWAKLQEIKQPKDEFKRLF